jgi:excisionase family DNA binding protein
MGGRRTGPGRCFGNRGVRTEGDVIELLTIEEVAERLRVSVPTVRWLRQEGRFPPAIKVGRRLMWDIWDVDAWLKAQRETKVA